jgi:eukaryotic-like serine/threonine-protein kinase
MPTLATIDAFMEVLCKSGLVDGARLRPFLPQASETEATPRKLAARLVAAGLLTRFQAEQLLLGKHRGYTLGKYRILERIGAGGHSTVYLAEHLVVKCRVAIKVLPTARSENPVALARFYREARAAGALEHPNLVKAHDIDQDNGLHFLVMDYVDGSSLQEIVTRFGPQSIERAAHYIQQAAQGLQAAFAAGLVHRDVKPANILLDRRGVVRVLDLGLARFHADDNPLTAQCDSNNVLGTADYVAPEQALNSHEVDVRADIYSLGGTFYFLLTGKPLFPMGKVTQKLIWHQTRQPTPLRELRPEVPAELAGIVERMIDKERARRYQTPNDLIEALRPWTATPIPPPREEEMPQLSPLARGASKTSGEALSNAAPTTCYPQTPADIATPTRLAEQTHSNIAKRNADLPAPGRRKPQRRRAWKSAISFPKSIDGRLLTALLILLIGAFTGMGIRLLFAK